MRCYSVEVPTVIIMAFHLVDTERLSQQALDKAASCILTDRSVAYARASWQQCTCCDEWIEDKNSEYTFNCILGRSPEGLPTVSFELKTRYPAYSCFKCSKASKRPVAHADGGSDGDDDAEAEQLSPLHVQAVYSLLGSDSADNVAAMNKGFIVVCPNCNHSSPLLTTPADVKHFIQQHIRYSSGCVTLQQALEAGTYNSPAAFGGSDSSSAVEPESVIKELLSRLVVMTACHIAAATRPAPTPPDQLAGEARRTAAATVHIRSNSKGASSAESQQLLPYRSWAVDALSLDSELLLEANWVRPSVAGLALENKPSLLDLVLAPPYIATAEHDAGMTADKLAVLLLCEQQRRKCSSLHRLAVAVAAAGGDQLPAAVAAVEAGLAGMLAKDAVFQHFPEQQRVQQFLDLAGISSIGDVVYALAQPHVHGRGPQSRHLHVCAVCGKSPAALKREGQSAALHRCKYCIISTCHPCRQEQQEQQPLPGSPRKAAAAAEQLCLWCQGHPDTQNMDITGPSNTKAPAQQQQQYQCGSSSTEVSDDVCVESPTAAAQLQSVRSSTDYDLVVSMAAAVAAAAGHAGIQHSRHLSPDPCSSTAHDRLQAELTELERLQAELQSAAAGLGIEGLQLPPVLQQQEPEGRGEKRGLSAAAAGQSKRQCISQKPHVSGDSRSPSPTGMEALAAAAAAADVKRTRAPTVPRCGQCKTCTNLQHRKGCIVNRQRAAEGKPPVLPAGVSEAERARAQLQMAKAAIAIADNALADTLLKSAGFEPLGSVGAAHGLDSTIAGTIDPLQTEETAQLLACAGFRNTSAAHDRADIGVKCEAAAPDAIQEQQQHTAPTVEAGPGDLVAALDRDVDRLCRDISGWCSSHLSGEHTDVNKSLQVIQQLKQQLSDSYKQTRQQLFLTGLQVLAEVVAAFNSLPDAGSKVVLACNIQRPIPVSCCPDGQSSTLFELMMCCWCKELQDRTANSTAATADNGFASSVSHPAADAACGKDSQHRITSGQCQSAFGLITQICALQYELYYAPLAAGQELSGFSGPRVVGHLRDAVISVMSGTSLLLMFKPEEGAASSWNDLAARWQEHTLRCKWEAASKSHDPPNVHVTMVDMQVLGELVEKLLQLKQA